MVTESQPLPELNVSERSDRGCFISPAPDKTQRYYTLKHTCFLNIDATNGGCHYVSVRMCERESHPGSPPAPVPLQSLSDDCICPFAPLLSSRPV